MLKLNEFTIGPLSNARPLALHLATDGDAPMLVVAAEEGPCAIYLAGDFAFHVMPCANRRDWLGIQIADVEIEVDEQSVRPSRGPAGSLTRSGSKLMMRTLLERRRGHTITEVLDGLPEATAEVHFLIWQITHGKGTDKRVLFTVQVADQG